MKNSQEQIEAQYRIAFEMNGFAMAIIDESMQILMANYKFGELSGYSLNELSNIKLNEFLISDGNIVSYCNLKNGIYSTNNNHSSHEFQIRTKANEIKDVDLTFALLSENKKSIISFIDITEFRKTERELKKNKIQYEEIFKNANDLIFTVDLYGNFRAVNETALIEYGYTYEEMRNTNFLQVIDPSQHSIVLENLSSKRMTQQGYHRYILNTKKKNGETVWLDLCTGPIKSGDSITGVLGIARDITEWKHHQEQLEESRYRFKEIADLLPGIICEVDMSFKLTYLNQKGFQTFGFTQAEFERGIDVRKFIFEKFHKNFEKDVYNIFHGDFGNPVVYSLVKKDKSLIQVLINSAPIIKNGTPVGVRTCIIDITERMIAEEKLRLSEERFRTIYDESPIGIAIFSTSGFNVDQNRSFKKMFSAFENQVKETDFNLFSLLSLDEFNMNALKRGNVIVHESEHCCSIDSIHKKRIFEWHITPIGIEDPEHSMFLAQVKDVTEQKEAQDAKLRQEIEAKERAQELIAGLRKELREKESFHNMVSRSPQMKQIFEILPEVAHAAATVLINGESGTGKELIARSLHELSTRKLKPFIAINCSALPDNLLESELFGYKAGAFTDAKKDKPGKFAQAEGGTIFLDEIGDISIAMQVKLLRVLQERVFEPLGGTIPVKANVRIIAATNKDLKNMVDNGQFREDLYYRINVVTIKLPSLNERRCDIPILCEHFIERFNTRYEKSIKEISKEAMEIMLSYQFPGNIRELENVIEHAFIFCKDKTIGLSHLPLILRNSSISNDKKDLSSIQNFEELEKMYLNAILSEYNGDKAKVAQRLGIHKATLFRKLKTLGLK